MSTRNRITVTPANEQQIRAEWFSFLSGLVGYDLDEYSLDTVKMFYNDAAAAGFKL